MIFSSGAVIPNIHHMEAVEEKESQQLHYLAQIVVLMIIIDCFFFIRITALTMIDR